MEREPGIHPPDGKYLLIHSKGMTSEIDVAKGKLIRVTKDPEAK